MNIEAILKKLKEVQVDTMNNLHSADDESELQLESATEEHNCDPAGGEDVKLVRPKAEKVKEYKTLSRTTPMDGSKGVPKNIYVTDGTVKSITTESLQAQLDDLKKFSDDLEALVARAYAILEQGPKNEKEGLIHQLLKLEINNPNPNPESISHVLQMLTTGF